MSERLRPDQKNNHRQLPSYEARKPEQQPPEPSTENHKSSERQKLFIESIAKKVEKYSTTGEKLEENLKENNHEHRRDSKHQNPGPALKRQARKRALRDIRSQLPLPSRTFSRVVNQPTVDALSEAVGNTVARPAGLLAGGIFSLISSLGVLLAANYYGYEYNFLIGMTGFVGGFIAGLAIEGLVGLLHKARN